MPLPTQFDRCEKKRTPRALSTVAAMQIPTPSTGRIPVAVSKTSLPDTASEARIGSRLNAACR